MRRPGILIFTLLLASISTTLAGSGRIFKVLPHYLDKQGRHALAPSLYERDAYQALLRERPADRSALRFDIQWKGKSDARDKLKLRIEARGASGNLIRNETIERDLAPSGWFSKWAHLPIEGPRYANFGELIAWRASLWDGDKLLAEQKSFLW
jgi:hypothetical protein